MDIKVNFIQTDLQYALFVLKSMSNEEFVALIESMTEEEIAALEKLIKSADAMRKEKKTNEI